MTVLLEVRILFSLGCLLVVLCLFLKRMVVNPHRRDTVEVVQLGEPEMESVHANARVEDNYR